jgi:antitoxin (DNA-binding transcriptional repressor) of toxin-antitoxin stability system
MRKAAGTKVVGVRELSTDTSRILRRVRERGEAVDIAYRGRVVARIVPVASPAPDPQALSAIWADVDRVASEIGRRWPKRVSAAQAVSEIRR